MRIVRDDKAATFTFVPVEKFEEDVICSMIGLLKPGDRIDYGGRDSEEIDGEEYVVVNLHAGSEEIDVKEVVGGVTLGYTNFVGGVKLVLRGSSIEDKYEVGYIRNLCFFGSSGLVFIAATEVDGKKAIITTGKLCKNCGGGMINLPACEWDVCNECAKKCEHRYVRGAVRGGGIDIRMGEYCDICGRAKPVDKEKSLAEHHDDVRKELGIRIIEV